MAEASRARAAAIFKALARLYPDAVCELDFQGPFQLAVATVLSAQCTDRAVNQVTPGLFRRWPTPDRLGKAPLGQIEEQIRSIGLWRAKARNLRALSQVLVEQHQGRVPSTMEALVALPGVGRKTANVILFNAFGEPGLAVDTHVLRVGKRLGLLRSQDPARAERELHAIYAPGQWGILSHRLIWHGRRVCRARGPDCGACGLAELCPARP